MNRVGKQSEKGLSWATLSENGYKRQITAGTTLKKPPQGGGLPRGRGFRNIQNGKNSYCNRDKVYVYIRIDQRK